MFRGLVIFELALSWITKFILSALIVILEDLSLFSCFFSCFEEGLEGRSRSPNFLEVEDRLLFSLMAEELLIKKARLDLGAKDEPLYAGE